MSLSTKKPSISIPEFQKPPSPSFSAYGQTANPSGNGFSLTEDPTQLADRQAAESVRRDLISSLGLSGSQSDPYAQTLMQENLRLSQPQLENSLIQRGLGGSSVYQGALTDLISKASTDAILNSQTQKLNTLSGLQSSYLGPYQQLGQNLLQLAAQTGLSQEQIAAQIYGQQLPYRAQVNYPSQSGLGGLLSGGLQGLMSGGPLGALLGGGTGFLGAQQDPYTTYLGLQGGVGGGGALSLQNLLGLVNGGRAF